MENTSLCKQYKLLTAAFVFAQCILFTTALTNYPVVRTRSGEVHGIYVDAVNNSRVAAYLGIPYAKAPIGKLRLAAPVPPEPWNTPKQAIDYGPSCIHNDDTSFPGHKGAEMWNVKNHKNEDCLHVNVWVPPSGRGEIKAVMVWIYGGSFYSGSTSLHVYDGRTLAALGDVIVVSFNYRIGPLGFLPPLGETPGNVGLLDQILALNWVRDNIGAFGGDPGNVSVFGESAGATSIGLHTISPLSRGLFQRAIYQSGNQMVPWATVTLATARARTLRLAQHLRCPLTAKHLTPTVESEILTCLRSKTAMEVFEGSWYVNENHVFQFPFVPVRGTVQIPEHPQEVTVQAREESVDVLAGFNSNEGSYFNIYVIDGFNISTKSLITKSQYTDGVAKCGLDLNQLGLEATEFFYSDWKNPDNPAQYRDALDNIIADYHIVCPTVKFAKLHRRIGKTYMFHLDYRLSNNDWPEWAGVMHGYEIELVFGLPMSLLNSHEYNQRDREVSKRMVKYWSNFAKYGNPNGQVSKNWMTKSLTKKQSGKTAWPPVTRDDVSYLVIKGDGDKVKESPNSFQCAFWEKYIPGLKAISSDWDDQESLWKAQFHRWQSSMDQWEQRFYVTSSKNNQSNKRNCFK